MSLLFERFPSRPGRSNYRDSTVTGNLDAQTVVTQRKLMISKNVKQVLPKLRQIRHQIPHTILIQNFGNTEYRGI